MGLGDNLVTIRVLEHPWGPTQWLLGLCSPCHVGEGWERVGEGWERVGEGGRGLEEGEGGRGWERVGRGLGEGWERVG